MRRSIAIAVTVVLFGAAACAQQYSFARFTPKEGLAQSQVRAMAQDAQGYLWFGTLGGASRFDGHGFSNYALQEGLPDAQVNAMLATRDGSFWLAAGASLARFDGRKMRAVPMPSMADGARVMALAQDASDRMFIATDGAGVFSMEHGAIAPLAGYPRDTASSARALLVLHDGSLAIGTRTGLLRWKNGACSAIDCGRTPESISALVEAKDGTLWAGTFGGGALRIGAHGDITVFDEEHGLLQNNVRSLLIDAQGRVWIASKFGLNYWDGQRMRALTVHQGMPNDNVYCLFEDQEGGLWIGTDGAGAMRYSGDRFVTWTVSDGLCSDLVMCAVSDARGDLWLGTYGNGVCRMDAMAMLSTLDGIPNNTVWCGLADADSSLWFGTSDGLCHVVRGRVMPLDHAQALTGERVLALHKDADGSLWCGTRDGLTIIKQDGGVQRIDSLAGKPLRSVRSIISGARGMHWLATDEGLVEMGGARAKRWSTSDGLCDNTVFCLLQDASDRLWIGTSNGLACFDGIHFRTIRPAADFGSNYVSLLLRDSTGAIWAGTNNGLFHFDPDSALRDASTIEHITDADGLRGMECNLNAGFTDKRGRLFFGTNAGLVMHDPSRRTVAGNTAPAAIITGTRSYLQPTDWKGSCDSLNAASGLPVGLRLAYRRNHITFDYTAIALGAGERVRFQYRLIGSDPDWLPATDARFASYSNLSQGDYTFQVRAAARAGTYGPVASFAFRIAPPFWLKGWFFALSAMILGALVFGVMRFRAVRRARLEKTRQLMLRSRMLQLEQQALNANMNRHFIFNALNSIQYHINKQDRTTANRYLTSFAKLIRKNLDASQSDMTSLAEELERLELYLELEHMRFKDKFRYALEIDPSVDTHALEIPAMMLQPYVENSIWHGILPMEHQGSVIIAVSPAGEGRVRITIADDGIGIEQSLGGKAGQNGDHISKGIEITKGRADVLRKLAVSDIRITGPEQTMDAHGQPSGTRVTIELPSKKDGTSGELRLRTTEDRITFEAP